MDELNSECTIEIEDDKIVDEESESEMEDPFFPHKTKEGFLLERISGHFRHRMSLIRMTIQRIYPDLEEEYKKDMTLIEETISKFQKSDKLADFDYDSIMHVLRLSNVPFVRVFIKSMFLNVFSELDAFTGKYLKELIKLNPSILLNNQKQFNACEIFECDSIDTFKEKVIEKEIDALKRESYVEQIALLEKLFKINKLREFDNWGKFVEITQRRNLIMHCDGVVSDQYCKLCKQNNSNPSADIGERLDIDYDYLNDTISILEEVSIKLTQTLWRKCFSSSEHFEDFDWTLNNYVYDLLLKEEWGLAMELSGFAHNLKLSSHEYKMMFLVNHCIALNKLNRQKEVEKLLKDIDFSAMNPEFLLAKCVLLNDIDSTIKLMHQIGLTGKYFDKETYASFPLFSDIKQEERFKEAYNILFGDDIDKEQVKLKIKEAEENEFGESVIFQLN